MSVQLTRLGIGRAANFQNYFRVVGSYFWCKCNFGTQRMIRPGQYLGIELFNNIGTEARALTGLLQEMREVISPAQAASALGLFCAKIAESSSESRATGGDPMDSSYSCAHLPFSIKAMNIYVKAMAKEIGLTGDMLFNFVAAGTAHIESLTGANETEIAHYWHAISSFEADYTSQKSRKIHQFLAARWPDIYREEFPR